MKESQKGKETLRIDIDPLSSDLFGAGVYLFLSYDLVNSTQYKNEYDDWSVLFRNFYEYIENFFSIKDAQQLDNDQQPEGNQQYEVWKYNVKVWKYNGDEVLLFLRLCDIEPLFSIMEKASQCLTGIARLLDNESSNKSLLSVKACAWIAKVDSNSRDEDSTDQNDNKSINRTNNMLISPFISDKLALCDKFESFFYGRNLILTDKDREKFDEFSKSFFDLVDFIGTDIDEGFRVSKHVTRRRFVVSAKLATVLLKLKDKIKENYLKYNKEYFIENKLRIVSYESLKGVWNERLYPIIWYEEDWSSFEKSLVYDEQIKEPIIKKIVEKDYPNNGNSDIKSIEDILKEVDIYHEIDDIIKTIEKTEKPDMELLNSVPVDVVRKLGETHCVARCFNDKSEIFIAKRSGEKLIYQSLWEFGCAQIGFDETFEDSLKKAYKSDFNIDIDVSQPLTPIKTYHFEKDGRKVPGIIFVASVTNSDKSCCGKKHTEIKWISQEEAEEMSEEETIPGFKNTVEVAFRNHRPSQ